METIALDAHAKINLTLDVTGRRADGYHTLRSVFQTVTLCDRITLSRTGGGGIAVACGAARIPCGRDNTVRRAAEAFFARTGIRNDGVAFFIEKKIPSEAGLGGGSADAAAALKLLNHCFAAGLGERELCEIGLAVGADVPFCVREGTMLAEGIGELLTPLPLFPPCKIVICKPSKGSGTREAYEKLDRAGEKPTDFTGPMLRILPGGNFLRAAACVGNAFEKPTGGPEVRELARILRSCGAAGACMTGSGSAVFGLFAEADQARAGAAALSERFREVFFCGPCRPGGQGET